MHITGIIPARMASSRFPGKPLALIAGKSMLQRVYERCRSARELHQVVVATEDEQIVEAVLAFGGDVIRTSSAHLNGTSRCAEALSYLPETDAVINIQGDEPLIAPALIDELALSMQAFPDAILTAVRRNSDLALLQQPDVVKALLLPDGTAMDFCRILDATALTTPYFYQHIGIYGFPADLLPRLVQLPPGAREQQLHLEQLRWLDAGYTIRTIDTKYKSISVDHPEDILNVERLINEQ